MEQLSGLYRSMQTDVMGLHGSVLALMDSRQAQRPGAYRRFVESGLAQNDDGFIEALHASPLAIGSESFRGEVLELYQQVAGKQGQQEDVSF